MSISDSRALIIIVLIALSYCIANEARALPDLIVDRVVFEGGGDSITVRHGRDEMLDATVSYDIKVYVKNVGTAAAPETGAIANWNGDPLDCNVLPVQYLLVTGRIAPLSAGCEDYLHNPSYVWGVNFAGTYALVARADKLDEADEGPDGEANNDFCAVIRVCSGADEDGDGVLDCADVCPDVPMPGHLVNERGRPLADIDFDCDVDLLDFGFFQQSFTGPSAPTNSGDLLASSTLTHSVIEYNGDTAQFVHVLVSSGSGGLSLPHDFATLRGQREGQVQGQGGASRNARATRRCDDDRLVGG